MNLKLQEPQVIYNAQGKRTFVLIPYEEYEELLEKIEDIDDTKVAKKRRLEQDVPFEEVEKRYTARRQK